MTEHLSLVQAASGSHVRGADDDLLAILDGLEAIEASAQGRFLIACDILRAAQGDLVRNAAAIALVDLGDVQAVDAIEEVLRRPGIATSAGTLLYAVAELGASLPLDLLLRLLVEGSYEAQEEALALIEAGKLLPPLGDAWKTSRDLLVRYTETADPGDAEVVRSAIRSFDGVREFGS